MRAFYGVKVRLVNPDGNDEIEIRGYNTSSKVTVKDLEEERGNIGEKGSGDEPPMDCWKRFKD